MYARLNGPSADPWCDTGYSLATDPNGFASLALLNSKWRSVAQQAHLYAHHLSKCPSYAMSHSGRTLKAADEIFRTSESVRQEGEAEPLRRLLATQPDRDQAHIHLDQLVLRPGRRGIQFSPSPCGHHILAYNSSRIYVIDVRGQEIEVKRELKILRRPAATCIKDDEDDASPVLLAEMRVDLYDLTEVPPQANAIPHPGSPPPRHRPLPCGSVLAAAYEGGIEVSSVNPARWLPTGEL